MLGSDGIALAACFGRFRGISKELWVKLDRWGCKEFEGEEEYGNCERLSFGMGGFEMEAPEFISRTYSPIEGCLA